LIAAYIEHAETYYRNADGEQTGEVGHVRLALRPVGELYAHTLARDFGPKALEALRTTTSLLGRDLGFGGLILVGWCVATWMALIVRGPDPVSPTCPMGRVGRGGLVVPARSWMGGAGVLMRAPKDAVHEG